MNPTTIACVVAERASRRESQEGKEEVSMMPGRNEDHCPTGTSATP
jgi:hypothetical protein